MGVHHMAFGTRDVEATHRFYTEAMGFELLKVEVGKTDGGWAKHLFYSTGEPRDQLIAFWDLHDPTLPAGWSPAISTRQGLPIWVNHLAFSADDQGDLALRRERWLAHGHDVMEIDHDWCVSIFTQDPNGILVEFCTLVRDFTPADRTRALELLRDPNPPVGEGSKGTRVWKAETMYIPKIMEQREADHMDKVAEQFTYLTSVIDGQAANPTNKMPVAMSITLGSKELPYMLSMKAFGKIEILDADRSGRWINIINNSEPFPYKIGVITYSSMNGYFLDQSYTYEAGSMIVSQSDEGNIMMIRPSFSIDGNKITFDVVNIISVGSKTIASGYGTYPIQTEFYDISTDENFTDVASITITTDWAVSVACGRAGRQPVVRVWPRGEGAPRLRV